jgi:hypothetical protein
MASRQRREEVVCPVLGGFIRLLAAVSAGCEHPIPMPRHHHPAENCLHGRTANPKLAWRLACGADDVLGDILRREDEGTR